MIAKDIQYFPPLIKLNPWLITNKDEIKKGQTHVDPKRVNMKLWERSIIESGDFIKVNKTDRALANYKKRLNEFRLPVSKILGHLPVKAESANDVIHYNVVLG